MFTPTHEIIKHLHMHAMNNIREREETHTMGDLRRADVGSG